MTSELRDRLGAVLRETLESTGIPGGSLSWTAQGERFTVCAGIESSASGVPVTPHSRFRLGCLTKLLTAMAAVKAVDSGALDLDRSIQFYLPELNSQDGIRVRHLLSHTSGYQGTDLSLPGNAFGYTWEQFLAGFSQRIQLFRAGSVFNYEHSESVVLGRILAAITGRPMRELLESSVPESNGVRSPSSFATDVSDHRSMPDDKGYAPIKPLRYGEFWLTSLSDWTMSTAELAEIAEHLLPGASRRAGGVDYSPMYSQQVDLPVALGGPCVEVMPSGFGLGLARYTHDIFGHNGSARGQTVALRMNPAEEWAFVIGLNAWEPNIRDRIVSRIIGEIGSEPYASPVTSPSALEFRAASGSYVGLPGSRVEVFERAQSLLVLGTFSAQNWKLALTRRNDNEIEVQSTVPHLSVSFFDGAQYGDQKGLMVGLNAFREEFEIDFQEPEVTSEAMRAFVPC